VTAAMAQEDRWLPGFNFNVEEWDAAGQTYETLAICRTLAQARAQGCRLKARKVQREKRSSAGWDLLAVCGMAAVPFCW
jgi:hypothetical protein